MVGVRLGRNLEFSAKERGDRIERFLGKLEQALSLYQVTDTSSGLRDEIAQLRQQIDQLYKIVSESQIRERVRNALDVISGYAGQVLPRLDGEWPDAPIRLNIEDLTVKVIRPGREDYLWEIGSGANWLAYHVAIMVALQRFFLEQPNHGVPGLLIFDQPSQVYFPKKAAGEETEVPVTWRDQDIEAVRNRYPRLVTARHLRHEGLSSRR